MAPTTHRYVAVWVGLALVGTAGVVALAGIAAPEPLTFVLLILGVTVAERVEFFIPLERADTSYTLIEAAITAGLLLFAPAHVVLGAASGMALSSLTLRAPPVKLAFNVAQTASATCAAAAVMYLVPAVGPLVAGRPVLGALGGMAAYVLVNVVAVTGLLRRLAGTDTTSALWARIPLMSGTILGTTAVGIVLAALMATQPALVPFIIAPLAAVHLAARGSIHAANLLEATRAEHARLERVVDGASDGILLLDADGVVQVWNPAMERMTGLPAVQAVGRRVDKVLTPSVRRGGAPVEGRWFIDHAHEGAAVRDAQAGLRHVDGGPERVVTESHALVFDDRGRCTGDVVVVRDVSRQQELERLRSDFVARVSHELRTPLTPIRGFANVLLRRGDQLTAEQRTEALERIVERADHLGEVVEDLLLVTRVDRAQVDDLVHPAPSDVRPVLEAVVANLRAQAPHRPVTLAIDPALPLALSDPDRTRQILDALLDNADRYSPPDAPIEVEADHVGDDVVIRVIDHGPGIPHDQRETVFEQFQRLENPLTMRTGGVGLGLVLARRLAEAMHGRLELAEPRAGRGAQLVLCLPTAVPADRRRTSHGAG